MAVVEVMTVATTRYAAGEITAAEFAQQLTMYMTNDVEFWSNYTPSYEPLRPLFGSCRGIDEIVARYSYENEHEVIEHGTGLPYDVSISGDVIYYTQKETAAFFDKTAVTWDMVTKVEFRDGKIARLQMFLDSAPIEEFYGSLQM
jgi:ketosteroid isomerase-like protein